MAGVIISRSGVPRSPKAGEISVAGDRRRDLKVIACAGAGCRSRPSPVEVTSLCMNKNHYNGVRHS